MCLVNNRKRLAGTLALSTITLSMLFLSASVNAADGAKFNPNPEGIIVLNTISNVSGQVVGMNDNGDYLFKIQGMLFATKTDPQSGQTEGTVNQIGTVSSIVVLDKGFGALMNGNTNWASLPALPYTMDKEAFTFNVHNSTFKIMDDDASTLLGHAYPQLGIPVPNLPENTKAIRMGGCGAVHEINGQDPAYANKKGTLCMNGTFTFYMFNNNLYGSGVSNCTVVLQSN